MRRFVALSAAILVACVCGAVVWILVPPNHKAVALFQVAAMQRPFTISTVENDTAPPNAYEIYRTTQQELIKSQMVLNAALGKTVAVGEGSQTKEIGIADLPIVKEQEDPAGWLSRHLRVQAPNDTELLCVSLTRPDRDEALALVQAVVNVYQNEVLDIHRKDSLKRLNELETAFTRNEAELRTKRSRLKELGQEAGGCVYRQALSFKQQVLIQGCSDIRKELAQIQAEKRKAEAELRGQEALAKAPEFSKSRQLPPAENTSLLGLDPVCINILKLQGQLAVLTKVEVDLGAKLKELDAKAQHLDASSTDLDTLRNDIRKSEEVLGGIAKARDDLTVELASPPRVSLVLPPEVRPTPSQLPRCVLAAVAGLTGFFGSVGVTMGLRRGRRGRPKPEGG